VTKVDIVGAPLTAQRYDDAVSYLRTAAIDRRRTRAHFATVHSVVESTRNPALRQAFASAEMVCMDGVPLVWAARLRGEPNAQRVCGPDVMLTLCDQGRRDGLRHFLVGGRPGTPEALRSRLTARYPGLEVVGAVSPPFREMSDEEDAALVETINAARPDVLWVGLGSPKQDLWAAEHEHALDVPLILPVGAAFDFHSGGLRRAPRWMRRIGLEWLFRFAAEPRRLWRRYLTTNVRFVWLLARDELSRRRSR
jgi:N-acetylglucosaminyldiphosphoundecaprenol N-acetyl-beta-D-mannosaminyltransferase